MKEPGIGFARVNRVSSFMATEQCPHVPVRCGRPFFERRFQSFPAIRLSESIRVERKLSLFPVLENRKHSTKWNGLAVGTGALPANGFVKVRSGHPPMNHKMKEEMRISVVRYQKFVELEEHRR